MATEKEMNQTGFEKIAKELTAYAEIIRSRQNQKQSIIDDFGRERKRYQEGKISKKALAASVPRVRKELQRLNKEIRKNINNLNRVSVRTKSFAQHQAPKNFRVSLSGIAGTAKKKAHRVHHTHHKKKK